MANPQHIEWLLAGVEVWNERRLKDVFTPDFEGADLYWEFRRARKLDRNGRIPLSGVDFGDPYDYTSDPNWFHDEIVNPPDYTTIDYGRVEYSTELPDYEEYLDSKAKLIGVNLVLADLTGANLTGADLTGSNLAYANFTDANLSEANLSGANLGECRFINSDLSSADLTNSILRRADLTNANLDRANVTNANLIGAELNGANLAGAKLWKAILYPPNMSPKQHSGQ